MVAKETWDEFGFFDSTNYELPGCVAIGSFEQTRNFFELIVNQVFSPDDLTSV